MNNNKQSNGEELDVHSYVPLICKKQTINITAIENETQQTAVKLYTEKQVRDAMDKASELTGDTRYCSYAFTNDEVLAGLVHIELPSDEEIEQSSLKWFMTANKHEIIFDLGWMKIFEAGAKYAINKIQGGNQ